MPLNGLVFACFVKDIDKKPGYCWTIEYKLKLKISINAII